MPTYVCTAREGQLSPDQKSRIAAAVTRIHSEVTGAPKFFAQVIFEEVKPISWVACRSVTTNSTTKSSYTAVSERVAAFKKS